MSLHKLTLSYSEMDWGEVDTDSPTKTLDFSTFKTKQSD